MNGIIIINLRFYIFLKYSIPVEITKVKFNSQNIFIYVPPSCDIRIIETSSNRIKIELILISYSPMLWQLLIAQYLDVIHGNNTMLTCTIYWHASRTEKERAMKRNTEHGAEHFKFNYKQFDSHRQKQIMNL